MGRRPAGNRATFGSNRRSGAPKPARTAHTPNIRKIGRHPQKKRWRGPTLDRNERWPRVSTDKNVQHARVLRIDGFLVKPPGIKVFERKIRRILSDRIRQALGIDSEKD